MKNKQQFKNMINSSPKFYKAAVDQQRTSVATQIFQISSPSCVSLSGAGTKETADLRSAAHNFVIPTAISPAANKVKASGRKDKDTSMFNKNVLKSTQFRDAGTRLSMILPKMRQINFAASRTDANNSQMMSRRNAARSQMTSHERDRLEPMTVEQALRSQRKRDHLERMQQKRATTNDLRYVKSGQNTDVLLKLENVMHQSQQSSRGQKVKPSAAQAVRHGLCQTSTDFFKKTERACGGASTRMSQMNKTAHASDENSLYFSDQLKQQVRKRNALKSKEQYAYARKQSHVAGAINYFPFKVTEPDRVCQSALGIFPADARSNDMDLGSPLVHNSMRSSELRSRSVQRSVKKTPAKSSEYQVMAKQRHLQQLVKFVEIGKNGELDINKDLSMVQRSFQRQQEFETEFNSPTMGAVEHMDNLAQYQRLGVFERPRPSPRQLELEADIKRANALNMLKDFKESHKNYRQHQDSYDMQERPEDSSRSNIPIDQSLQMNIADIIETGSAHSDNHQQETFADIPQPNSNVQTEQSPEPSNERTVDALKGVGSAEATRSEISQQPRLMGRMYMVNMQDQQENNNQMNKVPSPVIAARQAPQPLKPDPKEIKRQLEESFMRNTTIRFNMSSQRSKMNQTQQAMAQTATDRFGSKRKSTTYESFDVKDLKPQTNWKSKRMKPTGQEAASSSIRVNSIRKHSNIEQILREVSRISNHSRNASQESMRSQSIMTTSKTQKEKQMFQLKQFKQKLDEDEFRLDKLLSQNGLHISAAADNTFSSTHARLNVASNQNQSPQRSDAEIKQAAASPISQRSSSIYQIKEENNGPRRRSTNPFQSASPCSSIRVTPRGPGRQHQLALLDLPLTKFRRKDDYNEKILQLNTKQQSEQSKQGKQSTLMNLIRQRSNLIMDSVDQFNRKFLKPVDVDLSSFLEAQMSKLRQLHLEEQKYLHRSLNDNMLYKIELENQVQLNSNLSYQFMELKKKESMFTQIIQEAKRMQDKFKENFEDAHEFLKSKPLVELMQKLYPTPIDPFNKKRDSNDIEFVEPDFDIDGKPQKKKKAKLKAPTLSDDVCSFSGVTNQLNEIMTQLGQVPLSPPAVSNPGGKEVTFEQFREELKLSAGNMQQQTALRLMARLKKPEIITEELAVQVGEADVNNILEEQITELKAENKEYVKQIGLLQKELEQLKVNIDHNNARMVHQMKLTRDSQLMAEKANRERGEKEMKVTKLESEARLQNQYIDRLHNEIKTARQRTEKIEFDSKLKLQRVEKELRVAQGLEDPSEEGDGADGKDVEGKHKTKGSQELDSEDVSVDLSAEDGPDGHGSTLKRGKALKRGKRKNKDGGADESNDLDDSQGGQGSKAGGAGKSPGKKKGGKKGLNSDLTMSARSGFESEHGSPDGTLALDESGRPIDNLLRPMGYPKGYKPPEMRIQSRADGRRGGSRRRGDHNKVDEGTEPTGSNRDDTLMDEHQYAEGMDQFEMGDLDKSSPRNIGVNVLRLPARHNMASKYAKIDQECQTDQEMLFDYIMAFLRALEDRLQDQVKVDEDLEQRLESERKAKQEKKEVQEAMERLRKESRQKLKELQDILMRITSLRNGRGGDIFFRGLAKTFQAEPVIPPANYYLPSGAATVFMSDNEKKDVTNHTSPRGDLDTSRNLKTGRAAEKSFHTEDKLNDLEEFMKERAEKANKKESSVTVPERFIVKTKLANAAGGGAFMKKKKQN